jgi:hypothetical protein
VPMEKVRFPFLKSNHPSTEDDEATDARLEDTKEEGAMSVKIDFPTYRMLFEPKSQECQVAASAMTRQPAMTAESDEQARAMGEEALEKLVLNNRLMRNKSKETIDQWKVEFAAKISAPADGDDGSVMDES